MYKGSVTPLYLIPWRVGTCEVQAPHNLNLCDMQKWAVSFTLSSPYHLKKGLRKNFVPTQIDSLPGQMVDSSYFTDSVVTAMFITPIDLLTAAVIAGNHTCQLYEHRYFYYSFLKS